MMGIKCLCGVQIADDDDAMLSEHSRKLVAPQMNLDQIDAAEVSTEATTSGKASAIVAKVSEPAKATTRQSRE